VDFQSAVETLRSLRKLGAQILIFEGGEPLLWRDGAYTFRDIARVAGSMFGAVCVTTNGTIPWHDLPVNRVWVSLDGPAGVHDSIRGEGVYDRVLEHIRKRPGRVMVSATINRFNAEAIPEMIRGLRGLAAGVTVQFHYPYEGRPDPWFIEPEERGPVLEELIRLKKAGFPVANSIGSLRDMKHAPWTCIDGFLANAEPDGSIRVGCYLKNRGIADCAACGFAAHNEMSLAFKGRIGSIIAGARIFFSG
jgi:MoaA/NifB/PqqE/SkfB family radical SAM enzyme